MNPLPILANLKFLKTANSTGEPKKTCYQTSTKLSNDIPPQVSVKTLNSTLTSTPQTLETEK